jgi:hypothetical protein
LVEEEDVVLVVVLLVVVVVVLLAVEGEEETAEQNMQKVPLVPDSWRHGVLVVEEEEGAKEQKGGPNLIRCGGLKGCRC